MTKREALDVIEESCEINHDPRDILDDAQTLIRRIYDSFESNICDNCVHFSIDEDSIGHCGEGIDDGTDNTNYQVATNDVVDEDFGCQKFIKDKE